MTKDQLLNLRPGDQIHWTDPDQGLCSKTVTIQSIEVGADDGDIPVTIVDIDGDVLQAFSSELS